ncbi:hypothetical protein Mal15_03130 [Stieleria maiorica]|uniref:Uncharacterized protein n=1 Tax=Stieleria maiorica TaxID=2795974 RepID=A0A5B9M807_9BACT|nr:hypothetical protein [Stieleria maiorica]QEF96286.1 hypothetical protein Mal15_03130 [Stieleria maiorica]
MRSVVLLPLLSAAIMVASASHSVAEENTPTIVVAIDQPTADLWRLHCPESKLEVLVRSDDEAYETINSRVLSARDATYVLFRRDRSSIVSQFFRERICNQGAQSIDLAQHFRFRESEPRRNVDCDTLRVVLDQYNRATTFDADCDNDAQQPFDRRHRKVMVVKSDFR